MWMKDGSSGPLFLCLWFSPLDSRVSISGPDGAVIYPGDNIENAVRANVPELGISLGFVAAVYTYTATMIILIPRAGISFFIRSHGGDPPSLIKHSIRMRNFHDRERRPLISLRGTLTWSMLDQGGKKVPGTRRTAICPANGNLGRKNSPAMMFTKERGRNMRFEVFVSRETLRK